MTPYQIDCFNIHMKFWKFLGIATQNNNYYYSRLFVFVFVVVFTSLYTINFYFLPRKLEAFIEELILYLTELCTLCKVFTFVCMPQKIDKILDTLESEVFRPKNEESTKILNKAKELVVTYWKVITATSVISQFTHVLTPLVLHLYLSIPLQLPVCSYDFLSQEIRDNYVLYLFYVYQSVGMHFHMLYHVNIDGFTLGLMILIIAQLKILEVKLRNVTDYSETSDSEQRSERNKREASLQLALNECMYHYDEIIKFCNLVEEVFSIILFAQCGVSSCIICVCLFRLTLPATIGYYVFLVTFIWIMTFLILVPCWVGTFIIETSNLLPNAIYSCDWTPRPRKFKSSMRIFVERANTPLSLTGGKMFPLSLQTFTSILNSAYSFFTLLRNVQSRET